MGFDQIHEWEDRDKKLAAACLHFRKTGEAHDILLPGFDQHGEWKGILTDCDGGQLNVTRDGNPGRVSPESLIRDLPNGETEFMGSYYPDKNQETVEVSWDHVRGTIWADSCNEFRAPNLKSVGKDLHVENAATISAPQLKTIGEGFSFGGRSLTLESLQSTGKRLGAILAKTVSLPQLESTGGNLWLSTATHIHAPKLKNVKGTLETRNAPDYYPTDVTAYERSAHPDAAKRWQMRQAAKHALKNQPSLEI